MNKNDLVSALADTVGLTKADASRAIDGMLTCITSSLRKGKDVRLVGFGTFSVAKRNASEGRNPRTGEKIEIPAAKRPRFSAGKALKEAVNR